MLKKVKAKNSFYCICFTHTVIEDAHCSEELISSRKYGRINAVHSPSSRQEKGRDKKEKRPDQTKTDIMMRNRRK
jgi:hypothetical protein